jgi:hypothetical protein
MDHISPILDGVLRRNRLKQGVVDYQLFSRWEMIVGEQLNRSTRPMRVQGGVLWVHVEGSSLVQHLGFLAPRLLTRIREEFPDTSIRRVRFTQRNLEPGNER